MQHIKHEINTDKLLELLQRTMTEKGTEAVRVKKCLYDEVKEVCKKGNMQINEYINTAIAEKLSRE